MLQRLVEPAPYPPIPYTSDGIDDVVHALRDLAQRSPGPIIGIGSCAGAWLLLRAAHEARVDLVLGMSLSHFGTDLRWMGTPAARAWIGRPDHPGATVPTTQAGAARAQLAGEARPGALRPRSLGSAGLRELRAARRWRRFRQLQQDWREAWVTGSAGLPVLRGLPERTAVHLYLTPRDWRRIHDIGAILLPRRRLQIVAEAGLDHSLLSETARRRLLRIVRREALHEAGRTRERTSGAGGDTARSPGQR